MFLIRHQHFENIVFILTAECTERFTQTTAAPKWQTVYPVTMLTVSHNKQGLLSTVLSTSFITFAAAFFRYANSFKYFVKKAHVVIILDKATLDLPYQSSFAIQRSKRPRYSFNVYPSTIYTYLNPK